VLVVGYCYTFAVEHKQAGRWDIPDELVDFHEPGVFWVFSSHWSGRKFFFGSSAWFPLRRGPPPAWKDSRLYQWFLPYDFESNDWEISWVPYANLFVDDWETEQVCVGAPAKARYASWFADGSQPFPHRRIHEEGIAPEHVLLYDWDFCESPVDRTCGRDRWTLEQTPPDDYVGVTWIATIAELLGADTTTTFKQLRRFGDDADLRVISRYT